MQNGTAVRRWALLLALPLLLPACASLVPEAPPPFIRLDSTTTQAQRESSYGSHVLSDLDGFSYEAGGQTAPISTLADYFDSSGDSSSAHLARGMIFRMGSAAGMGVWIAAFVMPLEIPFIFQYGWSLWVELGLLGTSIAIDQCLAGPAQEKVTNSFNHYLDEQLGLAHSASVTAAALDPSGFFLDLGQGERLIANRDEKDYFNASDWTDVAYQSGLSSARLGWASRRALGLDLSYELVNRKFDSTYHSGSTQKQLLDSRCVLLGPTAIFLVDRRAKVSLTLGLDLGYAWLKGSNSILDAAGHPVGSEQVSSQAICVGPRVLLRRPLAPWLSFAFEAAYRWCRFDQVTSSQATGTLYGAQPGKTWAGQPEAWDFSGPQLGLVVELGKIPFSR